MPTVWLQEHFWHGPDHLHWWDYAAWFLHLTHFFATFIAAAAIWVFAREHFSRYATMICVLALTGFATYVLYPAAPPWMAAQHGDLGESNRTIAGLPMPAKALVTFVMPAQAKRLPSALKAMLRMPPWSARKLLS